MANEEKPNPKSVGLLPDRTPPAPDVQTGLQPPSTIDIKQQHANKLAIWLLAFLGGGILLHYACVMILIFCGKNDEAKILEELFHSWLPVVSGLAGVAVTYYFAKNGK